MPAPIGLGTAPSAYRLGHGIQRSAQSIIPAGAPRCAIPRSGFAYMPGRTCRAEIPYVFSVVVVPEGRPDRSPARSAGVGDAICISSPGGTTEPPIVPPGLSLT